MPFRSSSVAPQMTSNSPNHSPRTTQASTSNTTTDRGENVSDSLVIEDLDLADLDFSPSTGRSSSRTPEEFTSDEYNQGADYNSLFGDHIPSVVSEACLMNDLYILVKVPTNLRNYIPTSTASSQTSPKSTRASTSSTFVANRKIFSIPEEESVDFVEVPKSKIPVATNTKTKKACWTSENDIIEEFDTRTSIVPLPNQVPEPPDDPLLNVSHIDNMSIPCQKQIEMQEINLNSVSFEGTKSISLKNYGILITPTKASKTDNLLVFQVDTEPKHENKKSGQLSSCFGWLTKCFRRKRRKTGVVQAKVYKTYFVKWKKCSEDNECSHCRCKKQKKTRRQSA